MYSVLIVDDNRKTRTTIRNVVQSNDREIGFVYEAEDGIDAYSKIYQYHPDIILLDMEMPRMNGVELLEKLYVDGYKNKIIIVSGHDKFYYTKASITYGVADYILKPINRGKLNEVIQKMCKELDEHLDYFEQSRNGRFINSALLKERKLQNVIVPQNMFDKYRIEKALIVGLLINDHQNNSRRFIEIKKALYSSGYKILVLREETPVLILAYTDQKQLKSDQHFKDELTNTLSYLMKSNNDYCAITLTDCFQSFEFFLDAIEEIHNSLDKIDIGDSLNNRVVIYDFNKMTKNINDKVNRNNELILSQDNKIEFDQLIKQIDDNSLNTVNEIRNIFYCYMDVYKKLFFELDLNSVFLYDIIREFETVLSTYDIGKIRLSIERYYIVIEEKFEHKEKQDAFENIRKYIDMNYHNDLTLEILSNEFYLNKNYISREFKRKYDKNIIEYINDKRLEMATILLKKDIKIVEICKRIGIPDQSYFGKQFKKKYNITPAQYINELNTKKLE